MAKKKVNILKVVKDINIINKKINSYKKFDFFNNIINGHNFKSFSNKQKMYFLFVMKNDFPDLYKDFSLYSKIVKNINQNFIHTKIKHFEV